MDSVEAKVYSNPLRVRILGSLGFRPATAGQLSRNLGQTLDKILYHLTVLCDTGYAEPVAGQDPDAPELFYKLVRV